MSVASFRRASADRRSAIRVVARRLTLKAALPAEVLPALADTLPDTLALERFCTFSDTVPPATCDDTAVTRTDGAEAAWASAATPRAGNASRAAVNRDVGVSFGGARSMRPS